MQYVLDTADPADPADPADQHNGHPPMKLTALALLTQFAGVQPASLPPTTIQLPSYAPAWPSAPSLPQLPPAITGYAAVIDGDTLQINGTRVRLWGVDAPETNTLYGRQAREWLAMTVYGRLVVCQPSGQLSHGRAVAQCFVNGQDLARQLVMYGLALDCERYSRGAYRRLESTEARRTLPRSGYCSLRLR